MKCLNINDYKLRAQKRLPKGLFDYIARGTEDEHNLRSMYRSLETMSLRQRILRDVSKIQLSTSVFGRALSLPIVVAPTAVAGLMWYDGEVELAKAARDAGIPFCVSTQSMTAVEAIAERASGADLWFQVYVFEDRDLTRRIIERARQAGVDTIVLTADTPRSPKKEWNTRNGFGIPLKASLAGAIDVISHPKWLLSVLVRNLMQGGVPTYAHYPPEYRTGIGRVAVSDNVKLAASLTWKDVEEIRRFWKGNLVIKGILDVEDAMLAVAHGCDGVVVSSHGGRNFDSGSTVVDQVPVIAEEVGTRMAIFADGGVQRGSDVVKYLSLGAQAVFCGRAPLYGMASMGAFGALDVLKILADEMDHCLAFCGIDDVRSLSSKQLA